MEIVIGRSQGFVSVVSEYLSELFPLVISEAPWPMIKHFKLFNEFFLILEHAVVIESNRVLEVSHRLKLKFL